MKMTDIPTIMQERLLKELKRTKTQFYAKDPEKIVQGKWITGEINGTVFSGHATKTTLGNSLRVLLYARFIQHLANIENSQISINVVGDDCLIILDRTCLESFRTFFFSAYRLIGKDEVKIRRVQGLG